MSTIGISYGKYLLLLLFFFAVVVVVVFVFVRFCTVAFVLCLFCFFFFICFDIKQCFFQPSSVVLTLTSVDEILRCDHSNERQLKTIEQYFHVVLFTML